MIGLAALSGLAGGIGGGLQDAQAQGMRRRLQEMQLQREMLALQVGQHDFATQQQQAQAMGAAMPDVAAQLQGITAGPGGPGMGGPQGSPMMPPQPQGPMGGVPMGPGGPATGQMASAAPPPGGGPIAPFASRFGPSPGPSGGPPMMPGIQQRFPGASLSSAAQNQPQQMPFTPQQVPVGGGRGPMMPQPMGSGGPQGGSWQDIWKRIDQQPISDEAKVNAMMQIIQRLSPLEQKNFQMAMQMMRLDNQNRRLDAQLGYGGAQADEAAAEAIASYRRAPQSLNNPVNRATMNRVYEINPEYDDKKYAAEKTAETAGARASATREANLRLVLQAANAAIPAVLEQNERVSRGRTGFVPLNRIIQNGMVATSDPELRAFGMANLQLAEHWARAMNPMGVMRESDRELALHFLSTADTKETYARLVNQLKTQITREYQSIKKGEAGFDDAQAAYADLTSGAGAGAGGGIPEGWSVKEH